MEVFDDPIQYNKLDTRFDYDEERWLTIGETSVGIIVVAHIIYFDENCNEINRIISARKETKKERNYYEKKGCD